MGGGNRGGGRRRADGGAIVGPGRGVSTRAAGRWWRDCRTRPRCSTRAASERSERGSGRGTGPGEQGRLAFHGLAPLPVDIRLAALAGLDTVLAGDVLMLWTVADALDHPMALDDQTGARLLARTRSGDFRRPQPSDIRRFWDATATLRGLLMFDPAAPGRWAEVAHVESFLQSGRVTIGPPSWRRFGKTARYILTAEGGRSARARIAAGKQGAHGRADYRHRIRARRAVSRGARPCAGPSARVREGWAPGSVLTLPLTVVAALMGRG